MTHMVMFRSAEGKPGYHHTDSLDEAIGFVEHLRNQEQVPEARIFRMEEIPIAVKTYYKVEVSAGQPAKAPAPSPAPSAPTTMASPSAEPTATASGSSPQRDKVTVPAEEPVVVEPMAPTNGGTGAGARFGRFNRS